MIILGIDPGVASTGYGIIEKQGNKLNFIDCGLISTKKEAKLTERLFEIYKKLSSLIKKYSVDVMAVEKLFFNKNVKTAMSVGEARGVIFLAGSKNKIEIFEYTPLQVKMALTGYGVADKTQIGKMVKMLLNLSVVPKPDDVSDALAIALCHASSEKINKLKWGNFMIDFLEGVVEDIKENYVIINVNGVGFKVNISFITYNTIKDKQTLRIHTYMNVKEDSIELYGFAFLEEKEVFLQLINISGIGPKAAMSILSNTTIDNFKQAISSGDEDALLKIPGLGSKKVKRILVELKDKFKDIVAIEKGQLSAEDDYVEALTVLGFKYAEAKKAIKEAMKILNNSSNKEEIIKQALKLLGR